MTNKAIKKSVLITGASSGLGKALALAYAESGVHLALTGRNQERLEAIAARCNHKGALVTAALIDITNKPALEQWIKKIDQTHPIDLCIANAGISAGLDGGLENDAQVRRIFDINVTGVFNTIHPVIDLMRARDSGQVALMASLAGFRGMPSAPAYCASKAAIKSYGEGLRGNLKPHGIKVSTICPGFVRSRITDTNRFKMPFLMEADQAANIIKRGLEKDKTRIAFPMPMIFGAWFLGLLPDFIAHKIAEKAPQK